MMAILMLIFSWTMDLGVGPGALRADRGRHGEPHRAEAARGDERARPLVVVILRFPHLVLADVGDDDSLTSGFFPKVVDDMSSIEVPTIRQALNVADG